ncbi:MAG: hypothetical protein H3Z50_05835 [archaeon]|nr:hypothetical protein [archaeon]MCP8306417.1 hypothetical protein [archaeon]
MTKLGGCIGLNEMTWIKPPPPTVLVSYYSCSTGAKPELLMVGKNCWKALD